MEALKLIPYLFLVLAISGIIAGAGILTLSKFGDTMDKCEEGSAAIWNDTIQACSNATNSSALKGGATVEWNATRNAQLGLSEVAEQFPTIGIIAVMVVIISLISGVFVYMRYFK